jgi:hypothetical protein
LSKAVLRRDISAVENILANQPQYLGTERNIFGHSAVHLAIGWPEGLEILLKATDEAFLHRDTFLDTQPRLSTPLDYAIAFGCTKSIRLLFEANTGLDFTWNIFIGTPSLSKDVSEVVLDIIIARLRQLFEFGMQKLPSATISLLRITCFESFHLRAEALLKYLEEENIQCPRKFGSKYALDHFWLKAGGLFHQDDISAETAIHFFEAGFKEIDSEVEGITPIMKLQGPYADVFLFSRYFRVVEFFIQRGARLDRQFPLDRIDKFESIVRKRSCLDRRVPLDRVDNQISNHKPARCHQAIHRVASHAWGSAIFFDFFDISTIVDLGSSQIWQNILQSSTSDPCSCACASGGCRPITLALKNSMYSIQGKWLGTFYENSTYEVNWEDLLSPMCTDVSVELLFKLSLFLDGLEGDQLVDDIIRYLTFSALGMTHTCCKHVDAGSHHFSRINRGFDLEKGKPYICVMDPAEVEEIHEEERTLTERLEFLHTKFMEDFRKLGVPLSRFLLENWRATMLSELSNSKEIPDSVKEQFSELGVSICTEPSSNAILPFELPDYFFQKWLRGSEGDITWIQQYLENDKNECNDPNEDYKRTVLRDLLKQMEPMVIKVRKERQRTRISSK